MQSPVEDLTLTIGQVAHMCGWSEPTFRKKRAGLEAIGFPKKLPGIARYSRPTMLAWFRTNGNQLREPEIEPALTIEIDQARELLEEQYAA